MSGQEIKVLLIASCDRSGSTVVGNILGSGANFFHGGEIHHVWGRGLIGNWLCGCGQPFRECDLWTDVLEDAFGGADRVDAHSMANLRMIAYSKQNRLLAFSAEGRRHLQATLSGYLENLSKLYRAIQTRAGAKVIVDSSKTAVHGWLLTMLPAIDLSLLHLVRDARGVAYSLGKKKLYLGAPEQRHMARHGPGKSSRMWLRDNLGIESLSSSLPGRSLKVRYEDFVAGPQDVLRSVCELVGEDASKLPPVVASRVEIQASHTVSGNPMRLATGALEIRPDEEWRAKMRFPQRALVTALTWPVLRQYGYLGKPRR